MNQRAIFSAALALTLGASGAVFAQGTTAGTTAGTTSAPPSSTSPTSTMTPPAATMPSATAPSALTPMPPTSTTGAPVVSGPGSATNNAVNTQPQNNSGAPVPGANSFTQGEARNRMEKRGFKQVSGLKLDGQGIWRGKAMRNGHSVDVSMDYQGNVVSK